MRTIHPGEVYVHYRRTDDLSADDLAASLSSLSDDERARSARFVFDRDRVEYAAAHALLRTSLSVYAEGEPAAWIFGREPGGKPVLAAAHGAALAFNLAHTRGLVACAITGGADVGVDVEAVDRDVPDAVIGRVFSAAEQSALRRCPTDASRRERVLELWTLKEAYLKATGLGLARPPRSVCFEIGDRARVAVLPEGDVDPTEWHFEVTTPMDGYRLAVALRKVDQTAPRLRLMPCGVSGSSRATRDPRCARS